MPRILTDFILLIQMKNSLLRGLCFIEKSEICATDAKVFSEYCVWQLWTI